jgi:hypothetical protein
MLNNTLACFVSNRVTRLEELRLVIGVSLSGRERVLKQFNCCFLLFADNFEVLINDLNFSEKVQFFRVYTQVKS